MSGNNALIAQKAKSLPTSEAVDSYEEAVTHAYWAGKWLAPLDQLKNEARVFVRAKDAGLTGSACKQLDFMRKHYAYGDLVSALREVV